MRSGGGGREGGGEGEEGDGADINSNNPHLTGEKNTNKQRLGAVVQKSKHFVTKALKLTPQRFVYPAGRFGTQVDSKTICWSSQAESEHTSYFEVCYVDPNSFA